MMKKNQVMITALAIMIAVAGYLHFAGGKEEDTRASIDQDAEEVVAEGAIDITDDDYDLSGVLDLSEEDISQAALTDIDSLDEDVLAENTDTALADSAEDGLEAVVSDDVIDVDDTGSIVEAVYTSSTTVSTLSSAKLLKEQTRAKNKEMLLEIINNDGLEQAQKQNAVDTMVQMTDLAEKKSAAEIMLSAKGFDDVVVSITEDQADVVVGLDTLTDAQCAQIEDVVTRKTGIAAEKVIISTACTD
ncbi:MAG: SpoIIIAH-like family protein [Lachnospiraceae bacterium]|nr:SpoIIIAH-like family protein [Lachnospiraceae bacterium]